MTRVAIVVRTKDRPALLRRACDDILSQTHRDWELVIVNDGGVPADVDSVVTDRADQWAERVSVLHNHHCGGMEAAANRGIAATSAPYVVIHDDDDTWSPDFLAATTAALDEDPELFGVAVNTEIVIESFGDDGRTEVRERIPFAPPLGVVTLYDLVITNRVVPISLLLRRSSLDLVGGYDESLPVVGDWEMNLRLASRGDIAYLDGPVRAFWRQRPDASGSDSNSVLDGADLHDRYDRIVRNRALKEHAERYGIGDVLYLARHIQDVAAGGHTATMEETRAVVDAAQREVLTAVDQRFSDLQAHLEHVVRESARTHSLPATLRRVARRLSPFHRS